MTMRARGMALVLFLLAASAAAAPPPARPARTHRVTAVKARAGKSAPAATSSRTLEDIHIEGEIPVPQVLFITERDPRRFVEFQDRRYLRTSRKVGEDAGLPSRIVVTRSRTTPAQESSR
jgi:hypothetical protein